MCVALIGGMDRLEKHYIEEADKLGIKLKVFTKLEKNSDKKIGKVDAVVIFTDKVSHELKTTIRKNFSIKKCPCLLCHSCGVSSLRKCLENLILIKQKGGMS
jgi:hypothetical protein